MARTVNTSKRQAYRTGYGSSTVGQQSFTTCVPKALLVTRTASRQLEPSRTNSTAMLYSHPKRRYLLVLGSDRMEDSERVGWPVLFYGDVWPPTKTNRLRKDGDDTRQQYYVLKRSHGELLTLCFAIL